MFPNDRSRIAYLITLLSGKALAWATAVWEQQSDICSNYNLFVAEMKKVFDHSISGREASEKLFNLRQGQRSVADYSIEFRTLAVESGWNSESLFGAFQHGLTNTIKDKLVSRELPDSLDDLIALAIRIDSHLRERRRERGSGSRYSATPPSGSPLAMSRSAAPAAVGQADSFRREPRGSELLSEEDPMQLSRTRLSPAERQRRITQRCCLYCGQAGHFISSCPVKESALQ